VLFENPTENFKTKCLKDDQLFVCQLIRGQGSYIGFLIQIQMKNTWSGPHKKLCDKYGVDPGSLS